MRQKDAIHLFEYRDGGLFWRSDYGKRFKAGSRAGHISPRGYRVISIFGKRYLEHRIVYLMEYGFMPDQIDHINGIKTDNRIDNLRQANHSQNQMNTGNRVNSSGYRGVRFVSKTKRWAARIFKDGREIRIGTFSTPELASAAYLAKANELFGEFVRK